MINSNYNTDDCIQVPRQISYFKHKLRRDFYSHEEFCLTQELLYEFDIDISPEGALISGFEEIVYKNKLLVFPVLYELYDGFGDDCTLFRPFTNSAHANILNKMLENYEHSPVNITSWESNVVDNTNTNTKLWVYDSIFYIDDEKIESSYVTGFHDDAMLLSLSIFRFVFENDYDAYEWAFSLAKKIEALRYNRYYNKSNYKYRRNNV